MKQIIVTVGREHGSGGKYIAEQIAKQLGIAFYDKELLLASVFNAEDAARYDEKPVHLFIAGKPDQKRQRLMEEKSLTADQAALEIRRVDRDRKAYHNYYCDTKWGDARGYDLVVNSGKLGIEKTVDTLVAYVRAYQAQNE